MQAGLSATLLQVIEVQILAFNVRLPIFLANVSHELMTRSPHSCARLRSTALIENSGPAAVFAMCL
jgi:hypothetical protein